MSTREPCARQERRSIPAGQSAQPPRADVKLAPVVLDKSLVDDLSPTPGLLARIASAFAAFARYAGGSLHDHPLPEVREVGAEWRG
jgi:hypothetical protein